MNSVRIHVRGQMGVQTLQASYSLACLNDGEEPIICVNHGGLPDSTKNKLDLLFEPRCRIIDIDSTYKTPYWTEGVATKIFTNREKIFRWLVPNVPQSIVSDFAKPAIHIRGRDKRISSDDSLKHLISLAPQDSIIYTDDIPLTKTLTDLPISNGDPFIDWVDMYNSPELYASPSAFIISMLVLNPNKKVKFLDKKYCDGSFPHSDHDLLFINEMKQFCPNLEMIND